MTDKDQSIEYLKQVYNGIITGTREPISVFLSHHDNAEKLTKLVVALNYFIKALDAEYMSEEMDRTTIARKAILADLKRRALNKDAAVKPLDLKDEHRWYKPQDNYYSGVGKITCPICSGELRYSRAGYNGHVHAKCSTNGCVAWME